MILYLVKKYDPECKLWSHDIKEQANIEQWLMLQMSGQGPTIGQAFWFRYYHSEPLLSAYKRYVDETKRILSVVEGQLSRASSGGYLVLGRLTIADISFLAWYEEAFMVEVDIEKEYPQTHAWMAKMLARPAIQKAHKGRSFIPAPKIID